MRCVDKKVKGRKKNTVIHVPVPHELLPVSAYWECMAVPYVQRPEMV